MLTLCLMLSDTYHAQNYGSTNYLDSIKGDCSIGVFVALLISMGPPIIMFA